MTVTRSSLLLQLQRGGNPLAWRTFVDLYRPLIAHAVRDAGAGTDDVDDLVQEVLLKLVRVLPTFAYRRERGCFRGWLRRVAANQTRDRQRGRKTSPRPLANAAIVAARNPDEDAWRREFRLRLIGVALHQARADERPRTWQCFSSHVLECRSAAEVSREIGVSENAVYVNSSRVLSRIREFCALHGEELADDAAELLE
jgi:RNA polymerase sigma-70 factor (ECF subfamily)